jgi:hypothetical protein
MIRLVAFIEPEKTNVLNWNTIRTIARAQYDHLRRKIDVI